MPGGLVAGPLLLALLLVAPWGVSSAFDEALTEAQLQALLQLATIDPSAALAQGRALLDARQLTPGQERELLHALARASMVGNDDAATLEMALRLDSLARLREDPLAAAYAGFVRSERLILRGDHSAGLAEGMRAALPIQADTRPEVQAYLAYELCDTYTMIGEYSDADPHCRRAVELAAGQGEMDLAHAENLAAESLYESGSPQQAAAMLESSRQRFAAQGRPDLAAMVGDNLARLYIGMGRVEEGLQLSREALLLEEAAGRVQHAMLTRGNIARALAALQRHDEALQEMARAVAMAREEQQITILTDLLGSQSEIAEAAGDLPLALAASREVTELLQTEGPDDQALAAELEARYASRERDLRIAELENERTLREQAYDRQRLRTWLAVAVSLALASGAGLLFVLLRNQRRRSAELRLETLHDVLTGIPNRRSFYRALEKLLDDPAAVQHGHALLLLDLDHFKPLNDRGGHLFGDSVLRGVSAALAGEIAPGQLLARIGGEEFCVLAPAAGATEGMALAERLRAAVAAQRFMLDGEPLSVTFSVGVSVFDGEHARDISSWMRSADRAMYRAKSGGRDQAVLAAVS